MNFSDSEIVASILDGQGYQTTKNFMESRFNSFKYMFYKREKQKLL